MRGFIPLIMIFMAPGSFLKTYTYIFPFIVTLGFFFMLWQCGMGFFAQYKRFIFLLDTKSCVFFPNLSCRHFTKLSWITSLSSFDAKMWCGDDKSLRGFTLSIQVQRAFVCMNKMPCLHSCGSTEYSIVKKTFGWTCPLSFSVMLIFRAILLPKTCWVHVKVSKDLRWLVYKNGSILYMFLLYYVFARKAKQKLILWT